MRKLIAQPHAVVIGGGPAGLMAAEVMAKAGIRVEIFDAMPSVGAFLLAGLGGLNLTHSEPLERFVTRYAERAPDVASWLERFSPDDMRAWAAELGIETFVGSSGRVFPVQMKASPLLRGVASPSRRSGRHVYTRHRWVGFDGDAAGSGPEAT